MGGADSEVSGRHANGRVRKRVLQAGVRPADQQAARPEDRSVVALRARRRHQRPGPRPAAGGRADGADRRRPAFGRRRRSLPRAARPEGRCSFGASGSRCCSAWRSRTPTSSGSCGASGLTVASTADGWDVRAPTFRVDLLREVDLIEEVGRHYGFDRLEPTFPPMATAAPAPTPRLERDRLVRRVLTAAGLSEAVTFGFVEAAAARCFRAAERQCGRGRAWPTRCRPSSTRCGRRCCRGWSTPSRTTAGTAGATSRSSRLARGSPPERRNARRRARVDGSGRPGALVRAAARGGFLRRQGRRRAAVRRARRRRARRAGGGAVSRRRPGGGRADAAIGGSA